MQETIDRQEQFQTSEDTLAFRNYVHETYPQYFDLPDCEYCARATICNY
jgi:hypothetical protein